MIHPTRGRILVKKLPRYEDSPNPLQLVLVDKQKHYAGVRRGEVQAVGRGVYDVKAGDVVVFRADAGYTFDVDPDRPEIQDSENNFHWLKEPDCLAVEEPLPVRELQEA